MEIAKSKSKISTGQRKYALYILQDTCLIGSKPTAFLTKSSIKLFVNDSNLYENALAYKRLVGKSLYLTTTRPDLAYAIHVLSQFLAKPAVSHYQFVV